MENSLFKQVKTTHREYLDKTVPNLLKNIRHDHKPLWGQMTAQHMIEHLAGTMIFSTIISKNVKQPASKSQEETKQAILFTDTEFPRNIMNPMYKDGLPDYTYPSIDLAKQQLLKNIEVFNKTLETEKEGFSFNPFLGDLYLNEWLIVHAKHVYHHFTQFGL